jgi:hypothetical protein
MRILFVVLAIFLIATSSAYSQSLKSISGSEVINSSEDSLYTNISAGAGVYTVNFKETTSFGFNLGLRHQFSEKFYLEGKFYFLGKSKSSNDNYYILSLIPQWNVFEEDPLKIIIGPGLELWTAKDGMIILPLAIAKLEYNISKEFFISPEIKTFPFTATLNFGFRFLFRDYENKFNK